MANKIFYQEKLTCIYIQIIPTEKRILKKF